MTSITKCKTAQQRALLLSIPGEALSPCAIHALEYEISDLRVQPVTDLVSACATFDDPVRLVLVDGRLADELSGCTSALEAWHPSASIALIADDRREMLSRYRAMALAGVVRGVLPMDLRLDLWLSVIRLLASGGEYFPVSLMRSPAAVSSPAPQSVRSRESTDRHHFRRRGCRSELTDREIQVLDLVSRGSQNKTIAADLNLSEHTVKVHLHNIISKMHVSNRTEAASIYLERRSVTEAARRDRAVPVTPEESR